MIVKPIKNDGTFEIRFTKAMKYPKSWYDKVKQDSKKSKERYEQLLADSISKEEVEKEEDSSFSIDLGFRRQMRGSLDLNIFMEFEDEKMEDKIRMESYMVGLSPYRI